VSASLRRLSCSDDRRKEAQKEVHDRVRRAGWNLREPHDTAPAKNARGLPKAVAFTGVICKVREESKVDEHGQAIHEECYVSKLVGKKTTEKQNYMKL